MSQTDETVFKAGEEVWFVRRETPIDIIPALVREDSGEPLRRICLSSLNYSVDQWVPPTQVFFTRVEALKYAQGYAEGLASAMRVRAKQFSDEIRQLEEEEK